MTEENIDYFVRRAIEERQAAECTETVGVAAVHRDLAERYEALVQTYRSDP